jgi:uncharacterized membrane protein
MEGGDYFSAAAMVLAVDKALVLGVARQWFGCWWWRGFLRSCF